MAESDDPVIRDFPWRTGFLEICRHPRTEGMMGAGMEMEMRRERDLILVLREEAGRGIPAMVMESLGFQVLIARDSRSALSHFRRGREEFRLVLVEAQSISDSIQDFLEQLFRTDSLARVVVLSAVEEGAMPRHPSLIHLQPPLDIANLVQILNPQFCSSREPKAGN